MLTTCVSTLLISNYLKNLHKSFYALYLDVVTKQCNKFRKKKTTGRVIW